METNKYCFICCKELTVEEMTNAGLYPPQTGNMDDWEPIICDQCVESEGILDAHEVHATN